MIKHVDIVVCIKDYKIYDMNFSASKDDLLKVVDILEDKFMYPLLIKDSKENYVNMSWNEFQEHFITLAEWRDKQINSILDE
jgi:hypothetical protein